MNQLNCPERYSLKTFVQPSLRPKGGIHSPFFMERACTVLGVTRSGLLNKKIDAASVRKRWAVMLVLYRAKGLQKSIIAQVMNYNIKTIDKTLAKANDLVETDQEFASMVDALEMVS